MLEWSSYVEEALLLVSLVLATLHIHSQIRDRTSELKDDIREIRSDIKSLSGKIGSLEVTTAKAEVRTEDLQARMYWHPFLRLLAHQQTQLLTQQTRTPKPNR